MGQAYRIEVPSELAEELVADGTAVRPLSTRGGGLGEIVRLIVDGVNTGASVVTVAAASAATYRVSQRLAAHLGRQRKGQTITVVLRGPGGERTVTILPEATDEKVAEELQAALSSVGASLPTPDG